MKNNNTMNKKFSKPLFIALALMGLSAATNAQNKSIDTDSVQFVPRNELILTPEITEMLINKTYSGFINGSDRELSNFGIKDRAQLENLHLGKPIPRYVLENGNLIFLNTWTMLVMSDGEPLHFIDVSLEEDGQYKWAGSGSAKGATIHHNYEHKDLVIGFVDAYPQSYLMIRKNNSDVFVKEYDYKTREYFTGEYSLSDIINLIKE